MNSSKLRALLELLRPFNAFIAFLSIVVAATIAGGQISGAVLILLASLAGGLIAGGGNAINDVFDLEIDRINKPQRPLPRGAVTKHEARLVWLVSSALGLFLTSFLSVAAMLIAAFWVVGLYYYSRALKRTVLWGNLLVGVMTGLALVFGGEVVGHPERSLIPALFAFLINVARELVKDVEDMEGDARGQASTLPLRHGVKSALRIATLVLVVLVGSTIVPYVNGLYDVTYFSLVLLVDVAIVYVIFSMWRNWSPPNLNKLSLVLKLTMLLGLAAIYLGS